VNLRAFASRALRRSGGVTFPRKHAQPFDVNLPAPPRDRREFIWELLRPHLTAYDTPLAREDSRPGAVVAARVGDLEALRRGLVRAAEVRNDLEVHLLREHRILKTVPLRALEPGDLDSAHWLRIGTPHEISHYRIAADGYLTMLLVDWDSERCRMLALHSRAERVDWTELFLGEEPADTVRIGRTRVNTPIDVVYTWVDSADARWRADHERHSRSHVAHNHSADNEERYVDRDELRYSLRSVWMFMPFVRHIYIVTADQRPTWLADHPQISMISHREIFPDGGVLPTFNSHAIEACLHRIDGLSEDFVYFNDDVFLGREVTESDFFTIAGQAKVRLSPSAYIYRGEPVPSAIPTDWAGHNSVSLIERDFGLTIDRRLQHVPLPLKVSVLAEIEQKYETEVSRTRAARFRSTTDLAIPSMFGQYYAIATHRGVEWPHSADDYVYVNTGRSASARQYSAIMARRPKFFCLNVTRYDEIALEEQVRQVGSFLREVYPVPAPWELT